MTVRREFVDFNARRDPKTDRYCCRCQKDLKPGQSARRVYLDGNMNSIHPEDLPARGPEPGDIGWALMGLDCANKHGMEWSVPENQ